MVNSSENYNWRYLLSRRKMLQQCGTGFGMLALADLMAQDSVSTPVIDSSLNPLAAKTPHFAPKAKSVIFLFMPGGPSHVDLFDPKPKITQYDGQPLPFKKPSLMRVKTTGLLGSPFKFKKYGESGIDVSELFPHVAGCVDDICLIRSMVADNINHNGACLQMNTGEQTFSRPSMGSWLLYGLGSENQSLPGYMVISPNQPAMGAPLWGSSFLPASYQGTYVADVDHPISNLKNEQFTRPTQRKQLDLLRRLNEFHRKDHPDENVLGARIASFELAFRMQTEAPEAFNIEGESKATRRLYGIDARETETFGRQCLLARRMVERGVRYVQLYHNRSHKASACQIWDHHSGLRQGLIDNSVSCDLPIAGLLKDLKARGLLKDTLVIWGGEFGRTPTAQNKDGREHHPFGFSMWLAGGGVNPGMIHGATDDFGWHTIRDKVHVHDLHATILHLMGIDHEKLTYRHAGRDFRLTDVYGNVVHDIIA